MANRSNIEFIKLNFSDGLKYKKLVYPGLFLLAFFTLSLILSWKYFPSQIAQEGVIANREIIANQTFEVENKQATAEAQNRAMNSVKPVYTIDPFILNQLNSQLKTEFAIFSQLHEYKQKNLNSKVKELKSQLSIPISDESLRTFTEVDKNTLDQLEIASVGLVSSLMKSPIRDDDENELKEARKQARKLARELSLAPNHKEAVAELVSEAIRPNAKIDWDETYRIRQIKKDQVLPVKTTIQKGQVIVEKGKIVTPQHIAILEEMGMQRTQIDVYAVAGMTSFALLSILLVWLYLSQFVPEVAQNPKRLLLLIIIAISTAFICRLLIESNPYLAPLPIAAILVTVLISPKVALVIVAYLSLIIGIFTSNIQGIPSNIHFVAIALITGTVSVLSASRIHRRMDLVASSILIFAVNLIAILLFALINRDDPRTTMANLVYGGINGFGSGIAAVGVLPILEHLFGITTAIKLLELSNQSEPLLKKLLLEAPGTYHHSVIVGNLAEAAAAAVGEDPLLCRVGAYYHDIGKLRRPYFFIENQLGAENPHEKLSPSLSALIILSHVKDGIEMAKKSRLPEPIVDIIRQHHGTSIIAFFYHQAKQSDKDFPLEDDFRYPGPKPSSRAAAIVMLADCVEAAARTLQKPTPNKIEALVRQIVNNHLKDGQLDESPLSLKNINDIIQAFTRILTGIYHQRIEYPEKIIEEINPTAPYSSKVTPLKGQVG